MWDLAHDKQRKPCAQQWPGTLNPISFTGRGKSTGPSQPRSGERPELAVAESRVGSCG